MKKSIIYLLAATFTSIASYGQPNFKGDFNHWAYSLYSLHAIDGFINNAAQYYWSQLNENDDDFPLEEDGEGSPPPSYSPSPMPQPDDSNDDFLPIFETNSPSPSPSPSMSPSPSPNGEAYEPELPYANFLRDLHLGDLDNIQRHLTWRGTELDEPILYIQGTQGMRSANALQIAAFYGYIEIVEYLLDQGADINSQTRLALTALLAAINGEQIEIINFLIEKGADLLCSDPVYAEGIIHLAVAKNNTDILKLLINKGANPNTQSLLGATPLHIASRHGHTRAMKILIEAGADIQQLDHEQNSAVMLAAANGHTQAVRMLLGNGADPSTPDIDESTPLMQAASKGHTDIMKLLLKKGARINDIGKRDINALLIAISTGNPDTIKILLLYGSEFDLDKLKDAANGRIRLPEKCDLQSFKQGVAVVSAHVQAQNILQQITTTIREGDLVDLKNLQLFSNTYLDYLNIIYGPTNANTQRINQIFEQLITLNEATGKAAEVKKKERKKLKKANDKIKKNTPKKKANAKQIKKLDDDKKRLIEDTNKLLDEAILILIDACQGEMNTNRIKDLLAKVCLTDESIDNPAIDSEEEYKEQDEDTIEDNLPDFFASLEDGDAEEEVPTLYLSETMDTVQPAAAPLTQRKAKERPAKPEVKTKVKTRGIANKHLISSNQKGQQTTMNQEGTDTPTGATRLSPSDAVAFEAYLEDTLNKRRDIALFEWIQRGAPNANAVRVMQEDFNHFGESLASAAFSFLVDERKWSEEDAKTFAEKILKNFYASFHHYHGGGKMPVNYMQVRLKAFICAGLFSEETLNNLSSLKVIRGQMQSM